MQRPIRRDRPVTDCAAYLRHHPLLFVIPYQGRTGRGSEGMAGKAINKTHHIPTRQPQTISEGYGGVGVRPTNQTSKYMEKQHEYATKLIAAITDLLTNEDSEFYIPKDELLDGDNATHFIHVLASVVPCYLYNRFTGGNQDLLGMNAIATRLIFQNQTKDDTP